MKSGSCDAQLQRRGNAVQPVGLAQPGVQLRGDARVDQIALLQPLVVEHGVQVFLAAVGDRHHDVAGQHAFVDQLQCLEDRTTGRAAYQQGEVARDVASGFERLRIGDLHTQIDAAVVEHQADGVAGRRTGAGLVVGIIAYSAYHILNAMIDSYALKIQSTNLGFINIIQRPGKWQ